MKRRGGRSLRLLLIFSLLAAWPPFLPAEQGQPADMDKQEVTSRLSALQQEIAQLQKQLEASRKDYRNEQTELRNLDLATQATAKQLRALEKQHSIHLQELAGLEQRRDEQIRNLNQ